MIDPLAEELMIPALGALAAAPGGAMTLPDIESHLETRQGSTGEAAGDAASAESQAFRGAVTAMLSEASGSGSLVDRGFVTRDATGGLIAITAAGRAFIGR